MKRDPLAVRIRFLLAVTMPVVVAAAVVMVASHSVRAREKADASVLSKADIAFARATAESGMEGFLSFVADDAATIWPDAPVIAGKKAFGEHWAPLLNDPARSIRWEPIMARISEEGDLGYTVGWSEITRTDAEGKRAVRTGKYVTIWRRQPDGSWKVVFDSGVQDAAPQPAN